MKATPGIQRGRTATIDSAARVLLVEDDSAMAASIALMLRSAGFACETAALGADGLEIARLDEHDLIVLDLNLPDIDGYEVLRRLRDARIRTPVLILSGLAHIDNRIKGLGFGADDFMSKPFDKRELVARIQAIMRRDRGHGGAKINIGRLSIDVGDKTLEIDGKTVHLTAREFGIIEIMAQRKGQPVSKQSLMTHLYAADSGEEPAPKIIDVFICKLRKKIMDASGGADYIGTIWGTGYVLRDPAAAKREASPIESGR
jgi:two-component system cell cycle response regulator CtrA